jgi:hypothetical protein
MAKSNGSRAKGKSNGSLIRYLPARVEPGMFRGELLVYLHGYDLRNPDKRIPVQMLVDEREVAGMRGQPKRNDPASAWVKVTLAGEEKGLPRVILPQPAQPVGESMLVDAKDLKEKAPGG